MILNSSSIRQRPTHNGRTRKAALNGLKSVKRVTCEHTALLHIVLVLMSSTLKEKKKYFKNFFRTTSKSVIYLVYQVKDVVNDYIKHITKNKQQ